MKNKLSQYLSLHDLPASMFSSKVLLSGSAMIQLTLDQSWPLADTDIFCTVEVSETVRTTLRGANYQLQETTIHEEPNFAFAGDYCDKEFCPYFEAIQLFKFSSG